MAFRVASLLTLALATISLASPVPSSLDTRANKATCATPAVALPTSALPSPPPGVVLKYVALGIGSQNYTCKSNNASEVPASNGALATLHDATALLTEPSAVPVLPPLALSFFHILAILPPSFQLPTMGHHFFNGSLTPVFDLSGACGGPAKLVAKKAANAPAPADACKGTKGEGAVDWLYLSDAGPSTGGVSMVYRVETAGGKSPTSCQGQNADIVVPYSAEYWFYGPAS